MNHGQYIAPIGWDCLSGNGQIIIPQEKVKQHSPLQFLIT